MGLSIGLGRMVERGKVSSEGYADMLHNPDAVLPLWAAVTLFEVGFRCPQGKSPISSYLCFN